MIFGTLGRYFAMRFIGAALAVFGGVFTLVVLVDYVEMTRQASGLVNAPALLVAKVSFFRVPQVMERIVPFAVLIGAMACYFTLSRRHELVIARSAGMSAWQFVRPAVVIALLAGVLAAVVYNPLAASLREQSKRLEAELFGDDQARKVESFWVRQRSPDGQSIINASESRNQGASLDGITAFAFDPDGHFIERIHARTAELKSGYWELAGARVYRVGVPPSDHAIYRLSTNLTSAQARESFATPETVSFWQLPKYIEAADQAGLMAAAYRLQYQILLAKPFFSPPWSWWRPP